MKHSRAHISRAVKLFWFFTGVFVGLLLPHVVALIDLGSDNLSYLREIIPYKSATQINTFSYQTVRKMDLKPLAHTISRTVQSKEHSDFLDAVPEQHATELIPNYLKLFSFDPQQCRILQLFFDASANFIQQLPTTYPLYKQYKQGSLGFNLPALAKLRATQRQYEALSLFIRRLSRLLMSHMAMTERSEHPTRSLQAISNTTAHYLKKTAHALCPSSS